LLAVYVVVVVRHDRSRRTATIVAAGAALVAVLWFGPELVGSGDLMRAASRARQPNLDAPAFDAHPFLAVFGRSAGLLTLPVYVGAGAAGVLAWRRHDRLVLTLAAVATVLMVTVGAMTQAGFAGNLRYVVLPAAVVCVLAGAGWIELSRAAWRRRGRVGSWAVVACAGALAVAPVRADLRALQGHARAIASEAALDGSLPHVIARAGGRAVVLACGTVYTGAFQTQAVVWHLRVPQTSVEVDLTPTPPGTVVAPNFTALARSSWFTPIARSPHWTVRSSCR
jgi:hypothetical protein